jgi:hypothetical protein
MANLRTRLRRLEAMAGRRGDEIPIGELPADDRCRLAIYFYRALWPEPTRPPDAPAEAYLQGVEKVLSAGGPDLEETCRRCWAECERWIGKALDTENERRRRAGLPPIGEDRR